MNSPGASSIPLNENEGASTAGTEGRSTYSFWNALSFWAILGWTSFGGPAAQISMMQQELVEKRRWISPHRFLHALNYCMVLPGPEAQQLATYMGWLLHGPWGGVLSGLLFILPSLLIMTALGALYITFGQVPEVQGMLYGLKPAVLAIVMAACIRLGQKVLHGTLWWGIALGALGMLSLGASFVFVIGVAALVGWLAYLFSRTPLPGLALATQPGVGRVAHASTTEDRPNYLIDDHTPPPAHAHADAKHLLTAVAAGVALWAFCYGLITALFPGGLAEMAAFFTKAALVTFGGAYAVLPYVFDVAVEQKHWVSTAQMMDALALGETTPGPLIMINAFIGFVGASQHVDLASLSILQAGALGAVVVTFFTFLPSFVFILAGAPWVEASRRTPALMAPLTAISAAVVAVIVDLAFTFAQHILWPTAGSGIISWRSLDIVAAVISVMAILLMLQFKVGMIRTMMVSVALGLAASVMGLP
jgi:chromate transporter